MPNLKVVNLFIFNSERMKKTLTYFSIIIVVVFIVDVFIGIASKYYVSNYRLAGDYEPIDYLLKESTDSIIILGSSVALNSLMPSIIEDSLNTTCFNGAANAQRMVFFRTMLECIAKRHKPKLIILGLDHYGMGLKGIGRYNILTPYYNMGYETIDSCLESKNRYEKVLLRSNLYRFNTIWFRMLLYNFITPDERGYKGFVAKSQPLSPIIMKNVTDNGKIYKDRIADLNQIVNFCKNNKIKLIIYFPPSYAHFTKITGTIKTVKNICKRTNVSVYDDSQNPTFLQHSEWFHDYVHLDKNGAIEYTKLFIKHIREELEK